VGACDFRAGSKVLESQRSSTTGTLWLSCDTSILAGTISTRGGGVVVQGDAPHFIDKSGVIKVKGRKAGLVAIYLSQPRGNIFVSGQVIAQSQAGPAPSHSLWATSGNIVVDPTALLRAAGTTAQTDNSFFSMEADDGVLFMNGQIRAKAATGGWRVRLEAKQDVVLGPSALIDAKATGSGAIIGVNSQLGQVTLQGPVSASVSSIDTAAQHGAHVGLCARGDVLVDGATIDTSDGSFLGSIVVGAGGTARAVRRAVRPRCFRILTATLSVSHISPGRCPGIAPGRRIRIGRAGCRRTTTEGLPRVGSGLRLE
jgi:hypothetical protein